MAVAAESVTLQAAGTVGNFGPGFDVISLALADIGDRVTLARADSGQDAIVVAGPGAERVPTNWSLNVAGIAIDALRRRTGDHRSYHLTLEKPRPGGSGLGSSASSAAGAALAYARLQRDAGLVADDLIRAAYAGEAAAGGGNPDDVAAVVLGGIALCTPIGDDAYAYRRIDPPRDLHVAVVAPDLELATADMRALLPHAWPRADAIWNAARLAGLIDACHRDDTAAVGAALDDRLHAPYRKARMPYFDGAQDAAVDAGAVGACLSGSGPSMIAVAADSEVAAAAASAMADAVRDAGFEAQHFVARPELGVPHAR